jgi:hypothetical protein
MVGAKQECQQGKSEKFTADCYGKQDWQRLDEISAGMRADFSHPIPASPVSHARRLSVLPVSGHTILCQESGGQLDIYRRIRIIAPILTQRQEAPLSHPAFMLFPKLLEPYPE